MRDAISILMLTNILCGGFRLASRERNECPRSHEVLCEKLVSSKGFTYQVPHDMTVYLRDRHCEHGWSHANGTFIADSTVDGNKFGPFLAVAVAPENLTVSTCANIQWQIHCDIIQFHCTISYTVKLRATHDSLPGNYTFSDSKEANSPKWLTAVIVMSGVVFVIILSVTICFWKKCVRKPEYTPPGEGEAEAEDSE